MGIPHQAYGSVGRNGTSAAAWALVQRNQHQPLMRQPCVTWPLQAQPCMATVVAAAAAAAHTCIASQHEFVRFAQQGLPQQHELQ